MAFQNYGKEVTVACQLKMTVSYSSLTRSAGYTIRLNGLFKKGESGFTTKKEAYEAGCIALEEMKKEMQKSVSYVIARARKCEKNIEICGAVAGDYGIEFAMQKMAEIREQADTEHVRMYEVINTIY
jgi:predicted CopG family antitoxin